MLSNKPGKLSACPEGLPRQSSFIEPAVRNPFQHKIHLHLLAKIQVVIFSLTLAPLRVLAILLALLLAWPLAWLATVGRETKDHSQPLPAWRRSLYISPIKLLGQWSLLCLGLGPLHIRGRLASPAEAPLLVVAPHSSFFDVVVALAAGFPSMVSRAENCSIPLIGSLLMSTQPLLVWRKDPDSRRRAVKEIQRRATAPENWPQVLIFPEGTCTNRSCLIKFKPGAFIPGVPVQPVIIRYPNHLDTVTWTWQGSGAFKVLWLTLCQLHTSVEIEFLPVYVPCAEEKNDPAAYACNVQKLMAGALNVPVTEHTFEDCRLMLHAHELALPMDCGLVEFAKINRKLGLCLEDLQMNIERFADVARGCKGGCLTIDQFASHLQLPISQPLRDLFSLFDRDRDGTIDFREYVIGLVVLCRPCASDEAIRMAFQLFDLDGDGRLTEMEFSTILRSAFAVPTFDSSRLFSSVDVERTGSITYSEFRDFLQQHPEHMRLLSLLLDRQRGNAGSDISSFTPPSTPLCADLSPLGEDSPSDSFFFEKECGMSTDLDTSSNKND
uniref:lysophosphatidylcholine acyltransferase 2-like isoform X2 n=1 Tax=Myxine glutinosa TaxID=7769 RepID=UPI00358F5F0C